MDSVYYFIGHIGLELNHLLCVWERGGLWGCRLSNGHKRHSYGRTFRISASRTPPIKLDKCWYRQKSTPNNWYQWNGKKWICDGSATQRNLWPSQCNIWIYHCREEWISKLYNPTAKKKCVVRTKESFLFSFRKRHSVRESEHIQFNVVHSHTILIHCNASAIITFYVYMTASVWPHVKHSTTMIPSSMDAEKDRADENVE